MWEAFSQGATLPGTHNSTNNINTTYSKSVSNNQFVQGAINVCSQGGAVTEKLQPLTGLELGTSHNSLVSNLLL